MWGWDRKLESNVCDDGSDCEYIQASMSMGHWFSYCMQYAEGRERGREGLDEWKASGNTMCKHA